MACSGCAKRARRALDYVDRKGWRLPKPIRTHFERTARSWTEPDYSRTPGKDRVLASPHGERKP